ncbi:MAG: hypothetical protein IKB09_09600 [Oscillospiraceae bacterium]|nr:hypothetical protein [Oscillospiraceae bacterium]MBR6595188.1 hypothetical protein [Oscillospiraceae bacterium]
MSLLNDSDKKWASLLFVQDGAQRRVVEVPLGMADVGDLVEYDTPDAKVSTKLGLVVKKMDCERFGNDWSCVTELAQIYRGKSVFHPGWSRPELEKE